MKKIMSIKFGVITTDKLDANGVLLKKGGDQKVLITDEEGNQYWPSFSQWVNQGYSSSKELYEGGHIIADFYEVGDEMFNGDTCTKDNTIMREFSLQANPVALAEIVAIEKRASFLELSAAAAKQSRRRLAERKLAADKLANAGKTTVNAETEGKAIA